MHVLLNDTSVLLNLLAGECLEKISKDLGWEMAICTAVRDETKKLRDVETGRLDEIKIGSFIDSGLFKVLELSGEDEIALYVQESAEVDDGEAMSIAIAAIRGLELAIDDKRATSHARRHFPKIRLWSTPEILKHWQEVALIDEEVLKKSILLIELRARYFPAQHHPFYNWWRTIREAGGQT